MISMAPWAAAGLGGGEPEGSPPGFCAHPTRTAGRIAHVTRLLEV